MHYLQEVKLLKMDNKNSDNSWRGKNITSMHAKYIHEFACSMFLNLTRGEAYDLIKKIFKMEDLVPFELDQSNKYGNPLKDLYK